MEIQEWIYQGKPLKEPPENTTGFVYIITNKIDGKIYIGKKALEFRRKKKLTKAEKKEPGNSRKRFKYVTGDSKWKDYWGSSVTLKEAIEEFGKENFTREILQFAISKKQLTFLEVKAQFDYKVLEIDSYNHSILGRFWRTDTK